MDTRLSERKEHILRCIIELYMHQPDPVGSKKLLQCSGLAVSSATIRNEMMDLEQLGYITHPHTSAGRIPTDKGYRYFVNHLLSDPCHTMQDIAHNLSHMRERIATIDELFQATTKIVSSFSQHVGVLVFPSFDDLFFRYANLIQLHERKVLVVLATMSGVIKEYIVTLDASVDADLLGQIARFMNEEFAGLPFHGIQSKMQRKQDDLRDSYHALVSVASEIVDNSIAMKQPKRVWIDGMNTLFNEPEFQDITCVRPLFEAMEDAKNIADVFGDCDAADTLNVLIGRENQHEHFRDCSIVRKNFCIHNDLVGTISVLGPRRMNYGSVATTVHTMSYLMTNEFKENPFF